MSVLGYNGVSLGPYGLITERVNFQPQYDPSGTDYLFTEVGVSLSFILADSMVPALPGESPAAAMARIQHLLQVPRRGLSFKVGSDTLFSVGNSSTQLPALDAKNGPIPGQCFISRIEGDKAFRVSCSFTARIVDCPGGVSPTYLSHRYTETMDVNRLAMTRRTRTGTIITRSDLAGNNIDALRGLIAPSLEPDFLRLSSQYTLSTDGLTLSYTFVDEEQYLMPPDPAAEASGEYFEFTDQGAIRFGEVRLMLRGGKPTDKGVLLARALSVAMAKLDAANPVRQVPPGGPIVGGPTVPPGGQTATIQAVLPPILAHAAIREKMYENEVEVRLKARLQQLTKQYGIVNTDLSRFAGVPLGSRRGEYSGFDPGVRGSAQLAMIAAAMQDPCLRQTVELHSGRLPNQASLRGGTVPASVSVSEIIPDDNNAGLNAQEPGIYTQYLIKTRDVTDNHTFQMPVGKAGAPAAIIQTAAPTHRRVYEWTAEKVGAPPKVPNPTPGVGSNAVLAGAHLDPGQVEVMPDGGTLKYVACGRYEYFFKDTTKVTLSAGVPPAFSGQLKTVAGQPFLYSNDIIDINGNGFGYVGGGQASLSTGLPNLENG